MAQDDWRLRIELDEESAGGLLTRLHVLGSEGDLVQALEHDRLAVTQAGSTVFVYAGSSAALEQAGKTIDAELAKLGIEPQAVVTEHWLAEEDRWDDEVIPPTIEAEAIAAGYAPWEVRIECGSHEEARDLADELEGEGYGVVRRFTFVIAGTGTREQAQELAKRFHGEAGPGGELVWEVAPGNPFAVFGGLGSAGTPI